MNVNGSQQHENVEENEMEKMAATSGSFYNHIPNIKLETTSDDEGIVKELHNQVSGKAIFGKLQNQFSSGDGNGLLDQETSVLLTPSPSPVPMPSSSSSPIPSPTPPPMVQKNQYKAKSSADIRSQSPCKKGNTKNAWGNCSYSDLITKAIMSSPSKKMSLQEIYQWIGNNIPYFMDKKDGLTTAGWKNSVRHTLSIRKRFIRLPNYQFGNLNYKSLWTVDFNAELRRQHHVYQDKRPFTVDPQAPSWKEQVESWESSAQSSGMFNMFCSHCGQIRFSATSEFFPYQADHNAMRESFLRRDWV